MVQADYYSLFCLSMMLVFVDFAVHMQLESKIEDCLKKIEIRIMATMMKEIMTITKRIHKLLIHKQYRLTDLFAFDTHCDY